MTVGEAAQAIGLKVWDTALPQDWVDDVVRVTGIYPTAPHAFVWCYDAAKSFGSPFPLTPEAALLLIRYYSNRA
jgi:hypothetical protein